MTSYLYSPSGPHTCSECSMGFSSPGLLAKHKSRFCVGRAHDMVLVRNCKRCESRCHCHEGIPEKSKYNPDKDPKLQSLAENHGKQMQFLSNRNRDLERQRDEIRRRLGELGKKPPDTDNTAALLAELRDQEARNQRLLDELKKQLLATRQPVAIIGEQQQVQQKKTYTYPVYYGNSLVAEISAIRQAYIQSGGNDPEILAQLAQMLAEAQAIEEAMRNKEQPAPKQKEKKTEITTNIMSLDLENERLNRQLILLQEQNMMARNRRKDDREVQPIIFMNYPPRYDRPAPSRISNTDHIILESGDNNSQTHVHSDSYDIKDCSICSAYVSPSYYPSGYDPYQQGQVQQAPYQYQYYPQYAQQQPVVPQAAQPAVAQPAVVQPTVVAPSVVQPSVVAPTTVAPSVVAPSVHPPTAVGSVHPSVQVIGPAQSLHVPITARAPPSTAAVSVQPPSSISGSAREPPSRKSRRK